MSGSLVFFAAVNISLVLALPLGRYMHRVYEGDGSLLDFLVPLERAILRFAGVSPGRQMDWKRYLGCFLAINLVWLIWAVTVLLFQGRLWLNPAHNPSMNWSLAVHSAVSFLTSTNQQHYSGETGATHFSQIAVFTFLQFMSAGASLCAGVAVIRGLKQGAGGLGNFWVDFVRSVTRVLLPLCLIAGTLFIAGGMPMNLKAPAHLTNLQGDSATVSRGPVAAMIPIKELGSNGGGFFGANDAHPWENPDLFVFSVHTVLVLLLPAAFIVFAGYQLKRPRFRNMVIGVMLAGLLLLSVSMALMEAKGTPALSAMGIQNHMGNMEGKELRFGAILSGLYSGENMAIPAGTLVAAHDSYRALSGIPMLTGMQIDAFFGGLGTGFINFLIYAITALFIATLMIGRTPELFGKKIGIREMQLAVGANLAQVIIPLVLAALACILWSSGFGESWLQNHGAHGFTTFLYEYVSGAAGNGSGFEGLSDNNDFWNLSTVIPMLTGRFLPIIAMIMLAGGLQKKQWVAPSPGTLDIETPTFGAYLFFMILVLNALCMLPALMLGPVLDHFGR